MGDDGTSGSAHTTGTAQGEEIRERDGQEPGRHDAGTSHANRPAGTSTARDSTGINSDAAETTTGGPSKPPA